MKNSIYKIVLFALVMMSFPIGCSDYLDEVPDNRTTLDSPEKVKELLVNAYPNALYAYFCEFMSDNAGDKGIGGPSARQLSTDAYFWVENFGDTSQDTPEFFWNSCYSDIAAANEALKALNDLGIDDEETRALKAEARIVRAYAHFMLVSLWAKTYNPQTAATDMGIPIVIEPETVVFKDYERASVEEVYLFIEKEIEEAAGNIDDTSYRAESAKFHFTSEATYAFATRFFLFKGDWEKAERYASKVLTGDVYSRLRDWNGAKQNDTYAELRNNYPDPSNPANLLVVEATSWWGRYYYSQRYGITVDIRNNVMKRNNPTGGTWAYRNFGSSGYYNVPKLIENFVPSSPGGDTGRGYLEFPLFSIEEVLLSRAEARVMLNDVDGALSDLNLFYSKRIDSYDEDNEVDKAGIDSYYQKFPEFLEDFSPYYQISPEVKPVLQALIDARRLEFIEEGLRWFDIRRLNIPITHYFGDSEFLEEQEPMELPSDSPEHQLQIPQSAMSVIEKNPR